MKVCMLLHKSVEHDGRVQRAARALREEGNEVTVVHLPGPTVLNGPRGFVTRSASLGHWGRRLPAGLRRPLEALKMTRIAIASRPQVVHAHDAAMLVPGYLAARAARSRLVYDSHELATGVPYRSGVWAALVAAIERVIVPRCDAVITVSPGIAERLRHRYGLDDLPVVVRNVPNLPQPDPGQAPDLRDRHGIGDSPLVLHQGAVAVDRGCETLIDAVAGLRNAHLLFLGAEDPYADGLRLRAAAAGMADRVHFEPPAPLDSLLSHTAQADVGVTLLEGSCENHRLALPNKVFEYAAAGIPVVASDLPELSRLVRERRLGWTADPADPASVVAAIERALSEWPGNGGRLVNALSWDQEREELLRAYRSLVEPPSRGERSAPEGTAVVVRNTVTHDARVRRIARTLIEAGSDVTVVGTVSEEEHRTAQYLDGIRVLRVHPRSPLSRLRRLLRHARRTTNSGASGDELAPTASPTGAIRLNRLLLTLSWYRRGISTLRARRPEIVYCNDYNTMWIGVAAKLLLGSRLVYDSHELWPDRNGRREPRWWLLTCEAFFIRFADEVLVTSPGHADVLGRRYRIERPIVVRNIPRAVNGTAGADPDPSLLVYAGGVMPGRGLEEAIRALGHAPELRLRIVGPGHPGFQRALDGLAGAVGAEDRVEFTPAVPPDGVPGEIADGALGLALIRPICLSYATSLPNKLFEYLLAGVPVVCAADTPVIREFVESHQVGVVVADPGDPATLAECLRSALVPDRAERLRVAVARTAGDLGWEREAEPLAGLYTGAREGSG